MNSKNTSKSTTKPPVASKGANNSAKKPPANKNDKNSAGKPKAGATKAAPQNQGSANKNDAGNAKPKKAQNK